ncbi:MAG TPA: hypothetical protein VK982_05455 [Bacteroidales bacterium]|nr:hypothetical protein [Bacteroidales bacterium]
MSMLTIYICIFLSWLPVRLVTSVVEQQVDPLLPELVAESVEDIPLAHVISLDAKINKNGDITIYLADVFTNSVLVMKKEDSKLNVTGQIGQEGRGPGEFISVTNLKIFNQQNLLIYDRNLGRTTIFDLKKKEAIHVFNISAPNKKGYFPMEFYVTSNSKTKYYARAGRFFRDSDDFSKRRAVLLQQFSPEGKLMEDSLLVKPEDDALVILEGGSMVVNPQPVLGKKSIFRFKNDLIYYGWSGNNNIEIYTPDGNYVKSVKLELPRLEVTENDISLALDKESLMIQESKRTIRNTFSKQIPEYWPYFNNFLLDDQRRFWVAGAAHMEQKMRNWYIYSSKGRLMQEVKLPANFTVFQTKNNYIIGELLDEKFRSCVQIYRIN